MRTIRIIGAGALLAIASTAALAFQEQQGAAPAPASQAPAAKAAPVGQDLGISTTDVAPDKSPAGTEVRIPGLGKLGVLPKMDFGLELLYGATDGKQPERQGGSAPTDDLAIRGTLKHRF